MHILFLTQWFYPEPETKGLCFAKELVKNGHTVEILTGFPNYPTGKLYEGYKMKYHQYQIIDGIPVHRVPLFPSHDSSAIKRILNYFSFCISAMIIGLIVTKKADIIYTYHPPATIAIAAIFIKLIKRIPIIYDIQDLWPDTLKATGMLNNNMLIKIIDYYCRVTYKYCDRIVVLSKGFKTKLIERGVNEDKIKVVNNWSIDMEITNENEDNIFNEIKNKDEFIIMFAGNMGRAQKLENVLNAALKINQYNQKIKFVFIGDGIELVKLKNIKRELNLQNVIFINRVDPSIIGKYLIIADILLVHLRNDPLFEITIPSKVQAYLRIGKPILYCGKGDAAELIIKANAGVICEPESQEDIVKKIIYLYGLSEKDRINLGKNGKEYYEKELSLQVGTKKMIKIFNSIRNV